MTTIFCISYLLLASYSSLAQEGALGKLLEIFASKGVITPSEVKIIKEKIEEDRDRLLTREKLLKEKEEALLKKEKELNQREEQIRITEDVIGGLLQADYRYFNYDFDDRHRDPSKNKFDLRRVRLRFGGDLLQASRGKLDGFIPGNKLQLVGLSDIGLRQTFFMTD